MIKLAPSILSADFAHLGRQIDMVKKGGAQYLHIDVMDGIFVPNISFGIPLIKSLRKNSDLVFDVHLMIDRPERYIEDFALAGADIITFHTEATRNPEECISLIKSCGKKAGISIKPKTDTEILKKFCGKVDLVLIMSVEPGFGGQEYIEESDKKIREVREMFGDSIDISVDGGINESTIGRAVEAGANTIVAGSAVFKAEDIAKKTGEILAAAKKAEAERERA